MDNLVIPALIVLIVTNVSFALLARSWRRQAKTSERAAMGLALDIAHTARDSFDAGYQAAIKQATGGMYLAAMRTNADDHILDALRAQGRRLLGEPMEEAPVLETSSCETRAAE